MSQAVMLRAKGLYTYPNTLSEIPEGALSVADNVVIDRNGVIEPRRGFVQYGDTFTLGTDRAKQLLTYKNRILRHYSNILDFDNGSGTFTPFSGSYTETESGLRIKSVEANGNLYFTTSTGIKRISAENASDFSASPGYIRNAGGPAALDVIGSVLYTTAGFFTAESKVAYRVTWAFKDANGNLVEGSPSSRLVLTNYSTSASGTTSLTFAIPSSISTTDTQFFYRIYRTQVITADPPTITLDDIDPGDEMNLVIEDFPTSGQLVSRSVTLEDITPEDFRAGGSLLYTNPQSGEGILQSNTPPPLAKDIALYQNTVFYANTQTAQSLNLSLLGVTNLVNGVSTLTITQGVTTNTYTFVGLPEITELTFGAKGTITDGGYFLINSASNLRKYFVWFDKTGSTATPSGLDTSDRLGIRCDISSSGINNATHVAEVVVAALNSVIDFTASNVAGVVTVTTADNGNTDDALNGATPVGGIFAINVTQQGDGEDQANLEVLLSGLTSPSQAIDETARSLVNIINNNPLEVVDAFYLSGPDDVPGLILLQARNISTGAFSLTANNNATGSSFNPILPTSGTSVSSTNEVEPNALYYSKFQQPEAVPIVNKFSVGPKDKAILRILPLRNGLFVLKEDGIYRVSGQAGSFTLDPFDNTAILLSPDSAVTLNNQIYCLSTQGIITVSDTGVSVISRPIEGTLDRITSSNYSYKYNTFGVSYESDRAYLIWTVSEPGDTQPTQCFRFNTFTTSWTRFPIAKTCGIVKFDDDKLYLGAADENFIEKERKDFLRTDFADRETPLTLEEITNSNTIRLSSTQDVSVGDVLVQTQYLTLHQWNQLLKKLDLDPNITNKNYFSTLGATAGIEFRNSIDELANKLDSDPDVDNNTFASSIGSGTTFQDYQDDFNIIVNILNTASGVKKTNFPESQGTVVFEGIIEEILKTNNRVILPYNDFLISGPVVLTHGIATDVIWAPQAFGDPSLLKQIREGTFLFEDTVFYTASVGYASDLSPGFEFVDFAKSGLGDFGTFAWDQQNWGGTGSQVPLRTYIPRNCQKCRFLRPRFKHSIGREKFSLYGISLTVRPISERAYRS